MADTTEDYYTNICKKLDIDMPVFNTIKLKWHDKRLMRFMDRKLTPYLNFILWEQGLEEGKLLFTFAPSIDCFTLWLYSSENEKPLFIANIKAEDGEILGKYNICDNKIMNKFIVDSLPRLQNFIEGNL